MKRIHISIFLLFAQTTPLKKTIKYRKYPNLVRTKN